MNQYGQADGAGPRPGQAQQDADAKNGNDKVRLEM